MRWITLLVGLALAGCSHGARLDPEALAPGDYDREIARRFQYGPPTPVPAELADPGTGQAADAAYFAAFPNYDRSYSPAARAQALRLAAALVRDASGLSHEAFVLRVAEIAALADNGHSAIGENAFRKNTPRLPLRTYLFADGLFVLRADDTQHDLLGARVDRIDGRTIDALLGLLRRYQGGTEAHRRTALLPVLESPGLLAAAGAAQAPDALTLEGVLADGTPFKRRIVAERRGRAAPVSAASRTLYPEEPQASMASFLAADAGLPVSLRQPTRLFTLDALPHRGLYIGLAYNNDGDGEPIGPFLDSALDRVKASGPGYVVLDMRLNGGGDYTKTYAFAHSLPDIARNARIYVLTSPWTFSAAIATVAALKQAGGDRVTIVGDAVGDRLDFWAEGGTFSLPNAFVEVHYAGGRHRYDGPCRNRTACFWLDERYPIRVRSLAPDIAAPWTFAVYRAGRDPAMEAVLARETRMP